MKSTVSFVFALLLAWVLAWLPLGLWLGDPDYVLQSVSRHSAARQGYQILLYLGLLAVFVFYWRKHPPSHPGWGKPLDFFSFFFQGILGMLLLRAICTYAHWATWTWAGFGFLFWTLALGGCLAVGLVEEAIFRGFLLGHLSRWRGIKTGLVLSSALFATVHLFRPGPLGFKFSYAVGLFLLGLLLGTLAWKNNSIAASSGFHTGIIFWNVATKLETFESSYHLGWEQELASGYLSWLFTLSLLLYWIYLGPAFVPPPDDASLLSRQ